ncbi:SURF1 family protein [Actinotalea solisilvae]|uniref:SURF1 family protein n=1 Tax=Actinotalea solisilvae TaxID=2072922 RepID=UPI0027DD97FC|nr:SURF1 family protein [Actinotalea solisilvae]
MTDVARDARPPDADPARGLAGPAAPGTLGHAVRVLLVAVLVAAGCVAAGVWQWGRHVDRSAAIAVVERNYDAAPVPLGDVLDGTGVLAASDVWRTVEVRGAYLPTSVLLRNRPVAGTPAVHVLAPFVVADGPLAGRVLVVDRGWVPPGDESGTVAAPAPPGGALELLVHLRVAERASTRDAPRGQVQAVAPGQVREAALDGAADEAAWPRAATLEAYGALVSEDGARPDGLGALPAPSRDPGSHLSYAFQWWVFALGALGTGVVLVVRGVREGAVPPDGAGCEPRPAARARRRPTAEEEEDALLDAQTGGASGSGVRSGPA